MSVTLSMLEEIKRAIYESPDERDADQVAIVEAFIDILELFRDGDIRR